MPSYSLGQGGSSGQERLTTKGGGIGGILGSKDHRRIFFSVFLGGEPEGEGTPGRKKKPRNQTAHSVRILWRGRFFAGVGTPFAKKVIVTEGE